MQDKKYYSIGEVSKICGISKKALRYYDEIGLISPDRVDDENNYRFYDRKTLLSVPIIKYYKQMGFRLEEMKVFLEGNTFSVFEKQFRRKIDELNDLEKDIYMRITSVRDWYDLILEAESVIENDVREVSVKFIESSTVLCMEQDFQYNYMESIINIDFTNYIESVRNAITGPVMINFPSFREKMAGICRKARILQKPILECTNETKTRTYGGCMVVSCYHIGAIENISETYEKICDWTEANGYRCGEESIERYVTDYWTTRNKEKFVTEIMINISKK